MDQRTLEVSWTTLSEIIRRVTKTEWNEFSVFFRATGDIGSVAQLIIDKSKVHKQLTLLKKPLSILEVRRIFEVIAETTGYGSRERKERLIETLLGRATSVEAKYLVKILTGEMRTGFQEGLMELAVSRAYSMPLKKIQVATLRTGDISEVAVICKKEGKEGILNLRFKVFRPVKPMLAQLAENVKEALDKYHERTAFEYKMDGARIQIHKSSDEIRSLVVVSQMLVQVCLRLSSSSGKNLM